MNTTSADAWLQDGCGRCDNYQTPACKVHLWPEPLVALREILQASGLKEEMKWGSPCYTFEGRNVVMLVAFKEHCGLSFFKGTLLPDEQGVLESPGPNSQAMRYLKFTSGGQVRERKALVAGLLDAAIALEKAGAQVSFQQAPEPMPAELREVLDADPAVRGAFEALTPGRRRSHVLYVAGASQGATRAARAARCVPKIQEGKGFNER